MSGQLDPGVRREARSRAEAGSRRRARLAAARLYLICDCRPGGRDLEMVLTGALAGGVDVVQLRDKHASDDVVLAAAARARVLTARAGALLLINDRPDLAVAAQADGVHVGQDDISVARARTAIGPHHLLGLSTHAPHEIDAAAREPGVSLGGGEDAVGADYIGVGPVHSTPTKPGRPAVGLELVRHAARVARIPFFAIGGIEAGNIEAVLAAGARRVAVLRAIACARDPQSAARHLSAALPAPGEPDQRLEPARHG